MNRQKTGKSRICDHLPFEGMCDKIQVEILLDDVGKSIVVKWEVDLKKSTGEKN